jgi:hypothetical protein
LFSEISNAEYFFPVIVEVNQSGFRFDYEKPIIGPRGNTFLIFWFYAEINRTHPHFFTPHRAFAASRAISERRSALNFIALAFPPSFPFFRFCSFVPNSCQA